MSYEWRQPYDGYDFILSVGDDAGRWLQVADAGTGEELSIDLPTDPVEVVKLVRAILEATGHEIWGGNFTVEREGSAEFAGLEALRRESSQGTPEMIARWRELRAQLGKAD